MRAAPAAAWVAVLLAAGGFAQAQGRAPAAPAGAGAEAHAVAKPPAPTAPKSTAKTAAKRAGDGAAKAASQARGKPAPKPASPPAGRSAPGAAVGAAAVGAAGASHAARAPAEAPEAAALAPAAAPGAAPAATAQKDPAAEACALFVPRLPGTTRAACEATGLSESGTVSLQGVPIYWRDVVGASPAKTSPPRRLRVLVIGAIHGDELTSGALALRWIAMAGKTPRDIHWRFVPVANPDGLLARVPQRPNARGVDLNRNFRTPGWDREAPAHWKTRARKDPRRWPGPEPLSEPESQFVHAQIDRFDPHLVVSIHAPYGVLDFDGPHTPPRQLGALRLEQVGVFPGSLGHYGGLHRGLPVVTIELPHALRMPTEREQRAMWADLLRWMDARLGSEVREARQDGEPAS